MFVGTRVHTIGYWALGERSHVPLANLMRAHAQPGDMVVFQDLGQTPWAAMELRFVDPLGLVDSHHRQDPLARSRLAVSAHAVGSAGRRRSAITCSRSSRSSSPSSPTSTIEYVADVRSASARGQDGARERDAVRAVSRAQSVLLRSVRRSTLPRAASASSTSSGAKTTTGSFSSSVLRLHVGGGSCSTKAIWRPTSPCQTHTGETVKLSELRGKRVLLWFYPMADTPG